MPFTLRQVLGCVYFSGIALLAAGVIVVLGQHLSAHLREQLLANGGAIAKRLAEDSRIALIQRAVENIQPRLETTAGYPNVAGITVMTRQGDALVAVGSNPVTLPLGLLETALEKTRVIEDERQIIIIAAVGLEPEPARSDPFTALAPYPSPDPTTAPTLLGFVALTLSKTALQTDIRTIYRHVLIVMLTGTVLVGLLVLGVLSRITQPIRQLARVMSDPATVTHFRQVEVRGVREAQFIAATFNSLIAAFADSNRELVASNAALAASRATLAQQVQNAVEELKQQNAALVLAREQAVAASRVKSAFLANMSHEIRTPMHGVLGFITVLANTELNPTQTGYLCLLQHTTDDLLAIIDSILDFSKLEAGKVQLQREPFKLQDMLETTVRLFTPTAQVKGLSLGLTIDPQLPEGVIGDRQRLAQVIHNLVDNAIKFTDHGNVQVQVRLARQQDSFVTCHFVVRDTGIGIPPAHQATIFTAFNQVDASTTRQQGGTGLGLAICQQLIGLMSGRLSVQSQEGTGSSFQVEVHLEIARAEDLTEAHNRPTGLMDDEEERDRLFVPPRRATPIPAPGASLDRWQARSTRVLVVDDNPTNRTLAGIVLADFQTEVDMVNNGYAALTACRQQRYDLILMDIRMPEIDGLEVTRRIRRWRDNPNCQIPIIGLTADLLNADREGWRQAGLTDCLFKPLKVETLSRVFAQWGIGQSQNPYSVPKFR